jgi:hypothetical protein
VDIEDETADDIMPAEEVEIDDDDEPEDDEIIGSDDELPLDLD